MKNGDAKINKKGRVELLLVVVLYKKYKIFQCVHGYVQINKMLNFVY